MLTSIRESVPSEIKGYSRRVCSTLTGPRLAGTASAKAGLPLESDDPSSPSQQWLPSSPQAIKLQLAPSTLRERSKAKTG
jgi:hypothetical protein